MPGTKKAVFLSYASEDTEAATHICEALRAGGIEVWFDKNELRGGDEWDAAIRRQIRTCMLFVPIFSVNTHARIEGYFRLEWKIAIDRSHLISADRAFLLPVVIDGTPQSDERIPDRFRELQWTRLPGGITPPAFVERVAQLLRQDEGGGAGLAPAVVDPLLSTGSHPTFGSGATVAPPPPAAAPRSKRGLIAATALIAVAGVVAVAKFAGSNRQAEAVTGAAAVTPSGVTGPAAAAEKSIAVLPFVDQSEKKDQQYFTDGMAAAVLDLLVKVPGLRVIGHNSSFQLKDKANDLKAIGAELGATYIVQGSVRREGDQIRVNAQLIDSRDGSQRWSSTYNRKASDVFAVQDVIATNLARALQLTVGNDIVSRAATSNAAAYDVYLRGLQSLDQWSKAGAEEAAGQFQQALTLDPKFAAAALGRAKAYRMSGVNEWLPADVAFGQARKAADLALRLDPKLAEAHAVLGEIALTYDWDEALARGEIKQAQDLGGGLETLQAAARLAAASNQWAQATELFHTALAADPLDANLHVLLGWGVDLRSRRYQEAEAALRRALEISPDYGSARFYLGQALLMQNRLDEALDVMMHESPDNGQFEGVSVVYRALGKKAESDAWLKRAIEHDAELYPSAIAEACAYRGELDQAMKWLDKAYAVKDGDLYFVRHQPLMRNLEKDSRYQAFLKKMNLPD